jgi:prevent-host-death family protein
VRTVSVTEFRRRMGEYIAAVKQGEKMVITERGKPVAQIVPIPPQEIEGVMRRIGEDAR